MPFTPAHAVISLPFIKRMRAFSVLGLILGTMAPDFEYFIQMKPASMGGHEFPGMLLLNLPLCVFLAILYVNILEDGIIQILPTAWAKKWPRFGRSVKTYAIAEWLNFVFWSMAGMVTHVLWDSFTHKSGIMLKYIPVLKSPFQLGEYSIPVYKLLQHGGTALGLLAILVYLIFRPSRKRMPQPMMGKGILRMIFFGISAAMAAVRWLVQGLPAAGDAGAWIVSLISYCFISLLIVSLILKRHERRAIREFLAS